MKGESTDLHGVVQLDVISLLPEAAYTGDWGIIGKLRLLKMRR